MDTTKPGRFITLDVFRGLTVFLMMIVNTQGGGAVPYSQLSHSDWNGCTLTDLVFPSFLFAVGNAIPFVFLKMKGQPFSVVAGKILKRAVLIFIIGFLLGWYATMYLGTDRIVFAQVAHVRVMAVLQRIALCYAVAAILAWLMPVRWLVVISVIFLLGYWLLLHVFGIPGGQYTITGNAVKLLDLKIFGADHMYKERGVIFDPEGLLSTIPAIVNVILGYLAGWYIIQKGKTYACMYRLAAAGVVLLVIGLVWNQFFPMNKKLWTSSFVVFTSGIDLLVLSLLFYIIEIRKWERGFGLLKAFGKNPLFIYILANLSLIVLIYPMGNNEVFIDWINRVFFQKVAPGPMGCLLFSIAFALVMGLFAWIMDKKKIYVRV